MGCDGRKGFMVVEKIRRDSTATPPLDASSYAYCSGRVTNLRKHRYSVQGGREGRNIRPKSIYMWRVKESVFILLPKNCSNLSDRSREHDILLWL